MLVQQPFEKPDVHTIIKEFVGKRLADNLPHIKAFAVTLVKAHVEEDSE